MRFQNDLQFFRALSLRRYRGVSAFTLLLTLCCLRVAAAQDAAAPKPPIAQALSAKAVDTSKEALVYDQMHTRIRMEADGTGTRETTARVRVLADAGVKEMAVLAFTYTASNQQVDIGYVRVKKPDGTVVVTPDYNAQDMPADVSRLAPMYSDIHQKHVTVKGLGVGDTLEYQVTLRTVKPELPGQFWLEYSFEKNVILLDEQLDLDVPAGKPVTVASADVRPQITTSGDRKLYHWVSANTAHPDPDAPPKSEKKWKPSVQVTTFANWEQIGAWYAGLQKDSVVVTPAIQAKAAELTKGLTTDDQKLQAIFNEVALHIHYVGLEFGIGRYQPHVADDVLSNEYGDCKDKHTLLATLLKASGIEAWPVLISSGRELDPATPSPAQFDHVITLVPLNGKLLWMDSTEEISPVGTLMGSLRDKQTLAIPTGKAAYLERTPADLPYLTSARFEATGKLSDQGQFTGHLAQSYHGDAELLMRSFFRQVPQSQWKEFLQNLSNAVGFAGDVSNPEVSPIEQTSIPLKFSYDYTREKFSDWDNHRISPAVPSIGWELAPGVKQVKPADDVEIGSPGEQDYVSSIQLPADWSLYPPSNVDLKEDWAEYHASYSVKDGTFHAERRLVIKQDKVPLDQWDKYLQFRRAIYQDSSHMAMLSAPGEPGMATASVPLISGGGPVVGTLRQKIIDALQPLRSVATTLQADPAASADDVAKAVATARKTVDDIEAITQTVPADDAHSLYWAQALGCAWSFRGWAALDAHDLPAAENYLRAAWKLSQDRTTGYNLGRLLEAKGDKLAAAHQYQLAHIAEAENPMGGYSAGYDVDSLIEARYQQVTGKPLRSTALNRGQYQGSARAELDKDIEIRPFTRTTSLTGSGLFAVAFETGKPVKATLLKGDKGLGTMVPLLQTHAFPAALPAGSKARLLREVRLICTPWAGCDAYILLPTSVEIPMDVHVVTASQGTKIIHIKAE
jgi:Domain of Unknown Function with PDB structure (DUF3857)/Transglutaminase-like superfamily